MICIPCQTLHTYLQRVSNHLYINIRSWLNDWISKKNLHGNKGEHPECRQYSPVRVRLPKKGITNNSLVLNLPWGRIISGCGVLTGSPGQAESGNPEKSWTWTREGNAFMVTPRSFPDARVIVFTDTSSPGRNGCNEIGIFRRKNGKDSNRFNKTIPLCLAYLRLFTQEKYYAG